MQCDSAPLGASPESTGDRLGAPAQPEGWEGFLTVVAPELRSAGLTRVDEQDRINVNLGSGDILGTTKACPPCPTLEMSQPQWRTQGAWGWDHGAPGTSMCLYCCLLDLGRCSWSRIQRLEGPSW